MEAALHLRQAPRGSALLLAHCESVGRLDDERLPVSVRLEQALGSELAWLLLFALARDQGLRGSSSP